MEDHNKKTHVIHAVDYKRSYTILALIFVTITTLSYFLSTGTHMDWMRVFMGMFFVVFGFFKVLGLKEFALTYANYDLIAGRVKTYGYLYPFIELALGFAYLASFELFITNSITFVLMAIGSIGIWKARRRKIMCACLGTVVKLPLTTISLLEDVLMGAMALTAILLML